VRWVELEEGRDKGRRGKRSRGRKKREEVQEKRGGNRKRKEEERSEEERRGGERKQAESASTQKIFSKCSFLVTYEPSASSSDVVLPPRDLCLFLDEQIRGLREKFSEFDIMFPNDGKLITAQEARIVLVFMNIMRACQHFLDGVEYVEFMLRTQLISAIGKEVTAVDFANYMNFHNRKIFRENYQPQPFSYAIRQPDRFPEGVFGIDIHLSDGSVATPINTTVRHGTAIRPMRFSVSAATEIEFYGDRYLHAYVGHQFSSSEMGRMELVARARQWSSFVLMVGTIGGLDVFEPKHAIIVQNKDDLVIPLLLEKVGPSPLPSFC
jgi:hypothetical protein